MPSRLLLKRKVSRFMATYANMATCCKRYAQQATMEQQLLHEVNNAEEGQWVDLQLLIGHVLAQLLSHPLQVLEADLTCLIIIKQLERLQQPDSNITHMRYTGHVLADMWTASPMRDIRKMPETLMLQSHALRISSLLSRSPILAVIMVRNSSKSMVPLPSLSMSAIIFFTSSFLGSNPSALHSYQPVQVALCSWSLPSTCNVQRSSTCDVLLR